MGTKALKEKIKKFVDEMLEKDDYTPKSLHGFLHKFFQLEEMEKDRLQYFHLPDYFRCPRSGMLMKDPVVITSTGETYDRDSVNEQTQMIPNLLISSMIHDWLKTRGFPTPKDDFVLTDQIVSSLNLLCSPNTSTEDQKSAAKELRLLIKNSESARSIVIRVEDAISSIISPLISGRMTFEADLEEDLLAIIYHLSLHDSHRDIVANTPVMIDLLIEGISSGSNETCRLAVDTLMVLAVGSPPRTQLILTHGGVIGLKKVFANISNELLLSSCIELLYRLCLCSDEAKLSAADLGLVGIVMEHVINGKYYVVGILEFLDMMIKLEEGGKLRFYENKEGVEYLIHIIKGIQTGDNHEARQGIQTGANEEAIRQLQLCLSILESCSLDETGVKIIEPEIEVFEKLTRSKNTNVSTLALKILSKAQKIDVE